MPVLVQCGDHIAVKMLQGGVHVGFSFECGGGGHNLAHDCQWGVVNYKSISEQICAHYASGSS
jgi:hypothetical protein